MFDKKTYISRRNELRRRIGSGLILIPGNTFSPNNYPNNSYHFRQDSTFLYFFGLQTPSLFGIIDADNAVDTLFGDDFTVNDIIWTGPQPKLSELAQKIGINHTAAASCIAETIDKARKSGRRIHILPPYRGENKIQMAALLGTTVEELMKLQSVDLMFAVAEMREVKSDEEIQEMENAFLLGFQMHLLAMKMCRPGVVEREIVGAIEGVAHSFGNGVSFPSIVSQHGETLHNLSCDGVLEEGRLLLCDAGAENLSNYCSDHTRTFPVSGKFTSRQKDIYEIVLKAHDEVPKAMRTGARYHEDIHLLSYRILAEGLRNVGLIKGSADDAVESGAMYLFMPHGLGHGIGLDVHDCEAFGERSYDFTSLKDRAEKSAVCIHRSTWRLHTNTVLSDEPGIYFIPALIDKSRAEGLYKGIVNYDMLESFKDFGGIRIEDDIIVTENGGVRIGGNRHIPVTVEELESVIGQY